MSIPRRIIQTGRSRMLPLADAASAANLRLLHPGWDYVFFDDDDIRRFLAGEPERHRRAFAAFPEPISRFDFFRCLAVFRQGGFYFDLDVYLAHSLEPLLDAACVFAFEELTLSRYLREQGGLDWELANYGFGAAPGDPFLGAVIETCVRGVEDPAWAGRMLRDIPAWCRGQFIAPMTTGPGAVSRTFAEHPELRPGVTVLFPADVGDTAAWHQFGDFGVHLQQATWRQREGFVRRRLARFWENRRRRRLLPSSRILGPARSGEWISRLPDPLQSQVASPKSQVPSSKSQVTSPK